MRTMRSQDEGRFVSVIGLIALLWALSLGLGKARVPHQQVIF